MPKQFRLTSGARWRLKYPRLARRRRRRPWHGSTLLVEESGSGKKKLGDANRRRLREGVSGFGDAITRDHDVRQDNVGEPGVWREYRRRGCRGKL
jgi:hypothetical protein